MVFAGLFAADAMLIPSYRLESWCLLSDEVVPCDEVEVWGEFTGRGSTVSDRSVSRCTVERTFKGDLATGRDFTPEYPSDFFRRRKFGEKLVKDASAKMAIEQPGELPKGRVLLFLKKGGKPGSYEVLTAKLIQEDSVYQYGQFESNPGPVVLAPQKPENIALAAGGKYGEKELIEDLQVALEKARTQSEPVPWLPNELLANPSGDNSLFRLLHRGK